MRADKRIWLLVGLVTLITGWLPPGVAAAPPATPGRDLDLLFGIAGHAWWLDQHLDTFVASYRDLGVTSVRLSIDWKYIEPAPGEYRWDRYDRVLGRLADEQITIVGVFFTVPAWAASDPPACAVEVDEPRACDLPAERAEAFERVVRATLTRYPYIRYWEFWNEPDQWTHLGRDVGDYLPWLARFYRIAKEVDPTLLVAAGSLVGWDYLGWLYDVSEATLGPGVRPWDAIAFHPYNTHRARDRRGEVVSIRADEIERIRENMVARGDGHKSIWITEYGWDEAPATQAARLRSALRWLLTRDYVAMAHLHMLHDWERERYGLMRTEPDVVGVRPVDEATRFAPKEPYYSAFRSFPRPALPRTLPGQVVIATGQAVPPLFVPAWQAGGQALHGRPLTRPIWERRGPTDAALVQYFERCRLEWTPGGGVQFGLLGDEALQRLGWLNAWGQPLVEATRPEPPPDGPASLYFPETGHGLSGAFRARWEEAGGLAVLGYPRTGVLKTPLSDGTLRLSQWTQRALLEQDVSETDASPVRLGWLGLEAAQARGWLDGAGQPRPGYLNPARRAVR